MTATTFDMVVLNEMIWYHLAAEALRRSPRIFDRAPALIQECAALIARAVAYAQAQLDDVPAIRDGTWTDA